MAHRLARSKGYEVEARPQARGCQPAEDEQNCMRLSRGRGPVPWVCARRIEVPRDWRLGMLTMLGYAGRRGADIMRVCRCD